MVYSTHTPNIKKIRSLDKKIGFSRGAIIKPNYKQSNLCTLCFIRELSIPVVYITVTKKLEIISKFTAWGFVDVLYFLEQMNLL